MANNPAELLKDAISQIQARRVEITRELREIEEALNRCGIDSGRLANMNGRTLVQGASKSSLPAPSIDLGQRRPGQRKRRTAPSLDWLMGELRDGKRAQPELVRRTVDAGYSETAAIALLKKNAGKFKSERAPRVPGVRGNPAMIWSLRGA